MRKEIILAASSNVVVLQDLGTIPLGSVIVAGTPATKYVLAHIPEHGYIFQYHNNTCGHSGFSPTIQEAITKAISVDSSLKVYIYDTLANAIYDFFIP